MSSIAQKTLSESEVRNGQDPSVSKQLDKTTPIEQQIEDFYGIVDALKTGLLITHRDNGRLVSRCMAIGHREGPDIMFIVNKDSNKVAEIKQNSQVNFSVIETKGTNNWVSIAGTAEVLEDTAEIKKCYNPLVSAWFGDLGDGIHNGKPEDPRMVVVKVKAEYVSYWMQTRTSVGAIVDIAASALTGKVATPGPDREIESEDLQNARSRASA